MTIKKSARTRYRYVEFEYISRNSISQDDLLKKIIEHVSRMEGSLHMPKIKMISFQNNIGIIKCNAQSLNDIRTSLVLLYDASFRIKLLDSSGTIRGLDD
jgi:RNase P/RNase MRP subunit POP5